MPGPSIGNRRKTSLTRRTHIMKYPKTVLVGSLAVVAFGGYKIGRQQEQWLLDFVTQQGETYAKRVKEAEDNLSKCQNKAPEHHYSTFQQGLSQWRFDAVSGQACILISTAENWKRSEVKRQNCACFDDPPTPQKDYMDYLKKLGCF
jgi:hypothetical protein